MSGSESNISNSLKKNLGDIDAKKMFSPDAIKEAQEMINDAGAKFIEEAYAQVEEINKLYCEANCDASVKSERIATICQKSHILRSRMEALGFEFCYQIADSLYEYSRKLQHANQTHLMVVAKHIHAMQAALRENHANDGGTVGKEMVEMIHQLVEKVKAA